MKDKQNTAAVTITRAEYDHLNKAANKAVEHALDLLHASRVIEELQARIAELEREQIEMNELMDLWKERRADSYRAPSVYERFYD